MPATCPTCGKEFKNLAAHVRMKHGAPPVTVNDVTDPTPAPAVIEPELKKLPGFTMGVRTNSSVRMVKLASPICPYSKKEMERTPDGRYVPATNPSGIANCQLGKGEWWVECEKRGHDPYYRTKVSYVNKDVWEQDEDGNDILTDTKTIRREERVPNFIQCPVGLRYGGANDPAFKINRSQRMKGRKRLVEVGYEEVCQYRNCQQPVNKRYRSRKVGEYCSGEHLDLVAADHLEIALVQMTGRFELGEETKLQRKREQQLREARVYALGE